MELKVNTPQSPILFSVDGYRLVVMPVALAVDRTAEAVAQAEVAEAVAEVVASEAEAEDKPKRKHKAKEPVAVA